MLQLFISTENILTFFWLLFCVSYTHRKMLKKDWLHLFLFTLLYFLCEKTVRYIPPSFLKICYIIPSLLIFLLGIIYLILFYKKDFLNCFAMLISQTLCLIALRGIGSMTTDSVYFDIFSLPARQYLFFIFYYGVSLLFSFWFLKHPLRFLSELPVRIICFMFISPLFLYVLSEIYISVSYTNPTLSLIPLFFFLLLLLTITFTYYLFYTVTETYHEKSQSELIQQRLELQLSNVKRSIGMVEQIRRDKHEMKNVYFYIQSLLKSGELEELEHFVDTKLIPRYDRLEEFDTGNQFLDYLLTQKVNEARDLSIQTYADILIPSNLPIESSDLSGLMLNLLDNAIDASRKEPSSKDIHIIMRVVKSYLSIQVKNKVSEDVLKKNPQLKTSKDSAEKHGYGLKIVRSIVQKYNGILDIHMQAGYFCVNVLLEI